jgi:hypothetical protein
MTFKQVLDLPMVVYNNGFINPHAHTGYDGYTKNLTVPVLILVILIDKKRYCEGC